MMNWLLNEESGQGMVEYGLIIVLVSLAAIIGLGFVGDKLKIVFEGISDKLEQNKA